MSSDDSVLVRVGEEEHDIVKKKSMEAWDKQMVDREEHYASIRRSRGASFGKNKYFRNKNGGLFKNQCFL